MSADGSTWGAKARRRLLWTTANETTGRTVRVYRVADWDEFEAELSEGGRVVAGATYHTDDREDAMATARAMLAHPGAGRAAIIGRKVDHILQGVRL